MPVKPGAPDPPWTPFTRAEDIPELGNRLFLNSRYQVAVTYFDAPAPFGRTAHLSIKRRDKRPIRNWRDLQRIKNELCGPSLEAVEVFPAEGRLVDAANQYHLYCFRDYALPFGFTSREISERGTGGSRQEPFEREARPADCGARDDEAQRVFTTVTSRMGLRAAEGIATKPAAPPAAKERP